MGEFLPGWAIGIVERLGPLAGFLLLVFWYVPRDFLGRFVESQEKQAVALNSVAESLRNLPQRDEMKFESILIGQEMLNSGMERLHDRLDGIEGKIDGRKA